jgi:hypothetical protein
MKKIVIVCGLIAGLIVTAMLVTTIIMSKASGKIEGSMLLGYATMILAFSLIFVGIKNYRDKYNQGNIRFGKAFRIGLYITLIASTIYVIAWLITYFFFIPEFGEKYTAQMLEELRAGGASRQELDSKAAEMARFTEWYKNPFFNALITYTEILPVGLIISLISALVLKRKTKPGAESIPV